VQGFASPSLPESTRAPKIPLPCGPQMKISELRALLDRTSPEDMKRILVEVQWLRSLQREDLWQREYERAVQTGIEPRDSL
jgi:hypothetical protein